MLVERGDAVVVEGRRRGAEDGHLVGLLAEGLAVADQLPPDVAHRVLGAAPLELVDRHDVGEVEHVDLLQLRGGAELRRHHVHRGVDERHHRRVALTDAGRLHDDEVEAGRLEDRHHVGELLGDLTGAAGRQRTEVGAVAVQRVHPDPVAEQRAATLAPARVDGDHGDPDLVLLVDAEPAYQLVGQRGLPGAAGPGDAQHRDGTPPGRVAQRLEQVVAEAALLGAGDGARDRRPLAADHLLGAGPVLLPQVDVAVLDDGVDHPRQAEPLAVLGGEDGDPGAAQPLDLVLHDHPATTADDLDVSGALALEQLDEVLEVLHVPALVGRHRDALHVLLQRGVDHLLHGAVVPQVDDLAALALEDPAHDVDRCVVPVEQAGGGHQPDRVGGLVKVGHRRGSGQLVGRPTILCPSVRRPPALVEPAKVVGRRRAPPGVSRHDFVVPQPTRASGG